MRKRAHCLSRTLTCCCFRVPRQQITANAVACPSLRHARCVLVGLGPLLPTVGTDLALFVFWLSQARCSRGDSCQFLFLRVGPCHALSVGFPALPNGASRLMCVLFVCGIFRLHSHVFFLHGSRFLCMFHCCAVSSSPIRCRAWTCALRLVSPSKRACGRGSRSRASRVGRLSVLMRLASCCAQTRPMRQCEPVRDRPFVCASR